MVKFAIALCVVAVLLVAGVSARDADPLNDFCVADLKSTLHFNGLPCKATATPADFAFQGFRASGDVHNPLGIGLIPAFAGVNYPALNTQGIALAKFNYAKHGLVPPHTHPRASEVIYVVSGSLYVGFVDTAGKLYAATIYPGDVFLFPLGLLHFQLNVGKGPAVSVSALTSQSPGVQLLASSLFGASPPISDQVLSKAFGISDKTTDMIKKGFTP